MQIDNHHLNHEFPEQTDVIHVLRTAHPHFARLADEYHVLTRAIERLEEDDVPVDDFTIEDHKKKRVKLKDELYNMMVAYQAGARNGA